MILPANLRALNIARLPDGQYQASLQTDEHETNAYSVRIEATAEEAVRAVCAGRVGVMTPPPY